MTINKFNSPYYQRGGGVLKIYDGPYTQRGSGGFGSFFTGLLNFFKPIGKILKPIITSPFVKDLGIDAASTGLDIATEVMRGKKFKQAARDNLKVAKKRVFKTIHEHTRPKTEEEEDEEGSEQRGSGIKKMRMKQNGVGYAQLGGAKRRKKRRKVKNKTFKKTKARKTKKRKKSKKKISAKTIFH